MRKYALMLLGVLLVFGIGFFSSSMISQIENKKLKEELAEIKKQRDLIDIEKEQLKASRDAKIQEAELKEAEITTLNSTIEVNRRILTNERSKNQKALENYEKELANISIPVSNIDRCNRLCNSRAELGYPCVQDYCSQFK